jgi:hypothetical protein
MPAKRCCNCWFTSSRLWLRNSVATVPGSTTETRTCRRVTSWRSDSLKATTPNLVALYTPVPLVAARPPTELMLTRSATWRGASSAAVSRCGRAAWGGVEQPQHIHLDHLLPVVEQGILDGAMHGYARVVHQDV